MKNLTFILFLFILINYSNVFSQSNKWTYMYDWGGENDNMYSSYYDYDGLTYGDCYIEVWIKTTYNHYYETEVIDGSGVKKQVDYGLEKGRYYCGEKKYVKLKVIEYFVSGEFRNYFPPPLKKGDIYIDKLESEIIPGTNMERDYLFFCFK